MYLNKKFTVRLRVFLALTLLVYHPPATAQQDPVRALEAGDQVPDVPLPYMLFRPGGQDSFSDFSGKLVLLQFWSSTCGSSLLALPKLEALQQAFPDSLRIVTATAQPRETVEKFLVKNPVGQRMTLPIVLHNNRLEELFPHRSVPHLVWIGPDGRLLAQTSAYDATPATVQRLLRRQGGGFQGLQV